MKDTTGKEAISIEEKIKRSLKTARGNTDSKTYRLPEEISLSLSLTFREMKKKIEDSNDDSLKKEWKLYKEGLKIKFMKYDKDTMKEAQNSYDLGLDEKSFPNINFYFGNDVKEYQALNVIMEQTKLQREKNALEAEAMGVEVMSSEERTELQGVLDDLEG